MTTTSHSRYPDFLNAKKASEEPNFEAIQAQVHEWLRVNADLDYWSPTEQVAKLAEEVGEISREVMRRHGPKKKDKYDPDNLKLELCDAIFEIVCIANSNGINLSEAWKSAKAKKELKNSPQRWK